MCFEWKNRFACGHVGFKQVERCAALGSGCFGPDGTERFVEVEGPCYDCKARLLEVLDPMSVTAGGREKGDSGGKRGGIGGGGGFGGRR
ncbi:hypothetical protein C8A01DRAFT_31626 [Parachaetomium inaequale]|uniref:Uncharacterized protein n=1 Tax=Parachaetomium inaequale TaxID=2588326 RepID=A0AAN6PS57_9PEZI|nr:hypothetical protein C8A01DRAFT_31626 [Parachaetomium inaequale]